MNPEKIPRNRFCKIASLRGSASLYWCVCVVVLWGLLLVTATARPTSVLAQGGEGQNGADSLLDEPTEELQAPAQVDVEPTVEDAQIAERLRTIMRATGWFTDPAVSVQEGVVFVDGETERDEYREWATQLAQNTEAVVAVVNRIRVVEPLTWDLTPALDEVNALWRGLVRLLPLVLFGLGVLAVTWVSSRYLRRLARHLLRERVRSPLLRDVASALVGVPVFLLGIYIVLQALGLTRLALTVLGGTGLAGLVVGIAFQDIMENFLASILISVRQPFQSGDRILVAGHTGIVQQVTTRGTVLMALDGNHIQIPNSTIYKSTIINYTANPKYRLDFVVGIGYEDEVATAQALILEVVQKHPAVLAQPESLVLMDALGAATVNLKVLFWTDASQYEPLKVRSSVMRQVKRALEDGGITMPDEAREVIFPQGVPIVQMEKAPVPEPTNGYAPESPPRERTHAPETREPLTTDAEGDLRSDDEQLREQARQSRSPEEGADLLESDGT